MTVAAISLESLPLKLQKEIVGIVTRASLKSALLSKDDICIITGFGKTVVDDIVKDPKFPAPVVMKKAGHPRWKTAAVMAYINSNQREW